MENDPFIVDLPIKNGDFPSERNRHIIRGGFPGLPCLIPSGFIFVGSLSEWKTREKRIMVYTHTVTFSYMYIYIYIIYIYNIYIYIYVYIYIPGNPNVNM